jgi:biopolymer transport protein ExbD
MADRTRFVLAAEPNVIPFIDVLLVLLIIFMATAPRPTTHLSVDLPQGRSGAALVEPTIVALERTPAGVRIFVGEEPTTLADLGRRTLTHVLAADPALAPEDVYAEARVFVRSDPDVAYQSVVAVIDELEHANFRRVALIAPPLES